MVGNFDFSVLPRGQKRWFLLHSKQSVTKADGQTKGIRTMANFYKKSQSGRSMVEMLGVLAIIGVLSVAGIAGYTKAMEKWRINKAVGQIGSVVAAMRTTFINEKTYSFAPTYGQDNGKKLLDLGIISSDMLSDKIIVGNDDIGTDMVNPFKGGYWIVSDDAMWDTGQNKAFIIAMSGLHRNECMALATNDWLELGADNLRINGNDGDLIEEAARCYKNDDSWLQDDDLLACPNGKKVPIPVPPHLAAQACSHCNEYEHGCIFALSFRG